MLMYRDGRCGGGGRYMAAVDLRSLSLLGAMRRVGRGSGRTLTEPHRRHAARGPGLELWREVLRSW
jgi:hypothetical protein